MVDKLKLAVKATCVRIALAMPWGCRRAVLDGLLNDFGHLQVLVELGHRYKIESLIVTGENGTLRGSLEDVNLFGRYAADGAWALGTVNLLNSVFEPNGGTLLDIGANIGFVTVPVARNPNVQCYCFEPEPRNFSHLSYNIQDCEYQNVRLYQVALFDQTGTMRMALCGNNSGDHQIRRKNDCETDDGRSFTSVAVDRLDNLVDLHSLKRPIAIKLDTQGAEAGIFSGGADTLAAAELICFEFSPSAMRRIGGDVEFQLSHLQKHFREGGIAIGDSEEGVQWRPIQAVVKELRTHWEESNIGLRYFDVIVRK